jgi:hypothetical protein
MLGVTPPGFAYVTVQRQESATAPAHITGNPQSDDI